MSEKRPDSWRLATRLVRGGQRRSMFDETSEALFLTSGFVYDEAVAAEESFKGIRKRYIYSRYGNPTVRMFEERLAQIEGAEDCRGTASGMAAVHASMACQVRAGDRVVASRALFGSCLWLITELLPRYGVEVETIDGTRLDEWERALSRPTRCVFLETPSNPTLEIIDLKAVADLTHRAGGLLIVDNVFATPLLQKPMEFGADIVVYSATKHIDGQGRTLGGAILARQQWIDEVLTPYYRHAGPALSPFNAWVLLKGLESLEVRLARMLENTAKVAGFLAAHPAVGRVIYPGLKSHPQYDLARRQMKGNGTVLSFEVKGGKEGAFKFLDALALIDISNNLGDAKSLVTHPWTTTHQSRPVEERLALGITEGLVRLSVGLEDVQDLVDDLGQALAAA